MELQQEKPSPASVSALKEAAGQIPLGKTVKIRTTAGKVLKGDLRAVSEAGVSIGQWDYSGRDPELRSHDIAYDTMQSIEQYEYRMPGGLKAGLIVLGALFTLAAAMAMIMGPLDCRYSC